MIVFFLYSMNILSSCTWPYNQVDNLLHMLSSQEAAGNCLSPGNFLVALGTISWTGTCWMWQAVTNTHIATPVTDEVGEKRGRLYKSKAGPLCRGRWWHNTEQGLTMASSHQHRAAPDCPPLFATGGVKAQHHCFLQGRLCSYIHKGDAGRALLQLSQVTDSAVCGRQEVPRKRSLRTKLTPPCLLCKPLFTQEKHWSETFLKS